MYKLLQNSATSYNQINNINFLNKNTTNTFLN